MPSEKSLVQEEVGAAAAAAAAGNDQLVTLTKARPTHKHSQHSHSFSPYRCMLFIHCVFLQISLQSRTVPTSSLGAPCFSFTYYFFWLLPCLSSRHFFCISALFSNRTSDLRASNLWTMNALGTGGEGWSQGWGKGATNTVLLFSNAEGRENGRGRREDVTEAREEGI